MKKNWKVTTFNKQGKEIESWIIQQRTEKEAFNDANNDTKDDSKVHKFTMTESKVTIRDVKIR